MKIDTLVDNETEEAQTICYITDKKHNAFCMLSWRKGEQHIMSLNNLFVKKVCRHKGIATELMNYVISYAKSHGGKYLYLTYISKDAIAYKWYKRLGFKEYGPQSDKSMYLILNNC